MRSRFMIPLAFAVAIAGSASAQSVLFDFNTTPYYTPFPIDVNAGGIVAHLSGTGQGYSVQQVGTVGIAPAGFSGNCIFPSSVYASDLVVGFSKTLTDFSIMFSTQELDCDSSATMQVRAYMNGTLVGSSTAHATPPGTWPTGTLSFSNAQGFNSVVVHYLAAPVGCSDYGVIFLADNMVVTPKPAPACPADLDGNGQVDGADLGTLLGAWGSSGAADLNHDGTVDGADLGALLGAWGTCA